MSITITEVRNAASLQADNLRMDVEINHPDFGWIPYTVDPADTDTTIDNDAVMALIGSNFTAYVAPTQAELDAASAAQVRAERDQFIAETDWWSASDLTMTAEQTAYRQALRDVPAQAGFPTNVTWPTKPSGA